ncbi:hypothetical protein ACH5RR_009162 [Cinchona calisaya]|uniref:Uncharacterized protein n=1 Tax=Cinchona calisaya TaxID=153742 RepID=A0ABD3AGX7_9GENT
MQDKFYYNRIWISSKVRVPYHISIYKTLENPNLTLFHLCSNRIYLALGWRKLVPNFYFWFPRSKGFLGKALHLFWKENSECLLLHFCIYEAAPYQITKLLNTIGTNGKDKFIDGKICGKLKIASNN